MSRHDQSSTKPPLRSVSNGVFDGLLGLLPSYQVAGVGYLRDGCGDTVNVVWWWFSACILPWRPPWTLDASNRIFSDIDDLIARSPATSRPSASTWRRHARQGLRPQRPRGLTIPLVTPTPVAWRRTWLSCL